MISLLIILGSTLIMLFSTVIATVVGYWMVTKLAKFFSKK